MMKQIAAAALSLIALSALPAQADAPPNYGAILGSYVLPDNARDGDYGVGWQALYGSPVNNWLAVELNGYGHQVQHASDNNYDYLYGAGLDLRLGGAGDIFGGFGLVGFGAAYNDLVNEEEISPYANLGLGFLLQLPAPNLKLRGEGRYYALFDDEIYAGEDVIFDGRLSLGLQFLFDDLPARTVTVASGVQDSDGDGVIDSHDRCPGTIAGTEVTGQGCPQPRDEDGDGVINDVDACPGTPAGMLVDNRGCPAPVPVAPLAAHAVDTDGDGIPDTQDRCLNTRPGSVIDRFGCAVDEDDDGVLNTADACPSTTPGLKVDARGCVDRPQTVVLHNVNFEFDSARLTAGGRRVLDDVAAGLKGQPSMQVEIAGHTDALGPQNYNLKLSTARAHSVRSFLIDRGVDPSRLKAEGYGEFEPLADNETEEGRAQNRRVEFRVLRQ